MAAEEDGDFEVEELFEQNDLPREAAADYSVATLARRWLMPDNDSFATKLWAAGRLRDLQYAARAQPSLDAVLPAMVFKASLVLLAARMGGSAQVMTTARPEHLRLAPLVPPPARRILMPPDPDGRLNQYLDNRVSGMKTILVDYASSGEVTWLSIGKTAFAPGDRPAFLDAPELAHAELMRIDAESASIEETVERFSAYLRAQPLTGKITMRAALDNIKHQVLLLLGSDEYLQARDIFEFDQLAHSNSDSVFRLLSDMVANRAGLDFDERGHEPLLPQPGLEYHPAAPFLARAVQAWTAHGELQRKLLDGKYARSAEEMRARLAVQRDYARETNGSPPSPYTELRIGADDYSPQEMINAGIERMQPGNIFTEAAQSRTPGEFVNTLRTEDSLEVIERGGNGVTALIALHGGSPELHRRVVERFGGAVYEAPPAIRVAPNGSERFVRPATTYEATPVPFNAHTFRFEHWKRPGQKTLQYVRGFKIRTPLMEAMLFDPKQVFQYLVDLRQLPTTKLALPPASAFTGRRGWTVYTTGGASRTELAVGGESVPVTMRQETIGYVRLIEAVRLDARSPTSPCELPRVHTRGLVSSTWFSPLDNPGTVNYRRNLLANDEELLRTYLMTAQQLLGTNVVWYIAQHGNSEELRNLAVQMFGTHSITQKKPKVGREPRGSLPALGRRAGPGDETVMLYSQLGLGRFFREDSPPSPVLQVVGLIPLVFRIASDGGNNYWRIIFFPNAVTVYPGTPPASSGWATTTARQWRAGGSVDVHWARLHTDAELFVRIARVSGGRAPITKYADDDQYGQWLTADAIGPVKLADYQLGGTAAVPACLIYNDRHYVWIAELRVYAAQEQTDEYFEAALLRADVAQRLASETALANLEPLRSPGSPAWTRPDLPPPPPAVVAPLPPGPEELVSFEATAPLRYPASDQSSQLDALYSYTVASAVLRHADVEDHERLLRLVDRIGEFISRGTVATFFADACRMPTNRPLLSAIADFAILFDPSLFSWSDAQLPDTFIQQAIIEPLEELKTKHLTNDEAHRSLVSSLLKLVKWARDDLFDALQLLEPSDAGAFCDQHKLQPVAVCIDLVRTLIQDSKTRSEFFSAQFLREWFFKPRLYDSRGLAHVDDVAWLGLDQATADHYRSPGEGSIVSGLCALYALVEGRRPKPPPPSPTLPF